MLRIGIVAAIVVQMIAVQSDTCNKCKQIVESARMLTGLTGNEKRIEAQSEPRESAQAFLDDVFETKSAWLNKRLSTLNHESVGRALCNIAVGLDLTNGDEATWGESKDSCYKYVGGMASNEVFWRSVEDGCFIEKTTYFRGRVEKTTRLPGTLCSSKAVCEILRECKKVTRSDRTTFESGDPIITRPYLPSGKAYSEQRSGWDFYLEQALREAKMILEAYGDGRATIPKELTNIGITADLLLSAAALTPSMQSLAPDKEAKGEKHNPNFVRIYGATLEDVTTGAEALCGVCLFMASKYAEEAEMQWQTMNEEMDAEEKGKESQHSLKASSDIAAFHANIHDPIEPCEGFLMTRDILEDESEGYQGKMMKKTMEDFTRTLTIDLELTEAPTPEELLRLLTQELVVRQKNMDGYSESQEKLEYCRHGVAPALAPALLVLDLSQDEFQSRKILDPQKLLSRASRLCRDVQCCPTQHMTAASRLHAVHRDRKLESTK